MTEYQHRIHFNIILMLGIGHFTVGQHLFTIPKSIKIINTKVTINVMTVTSKNSLLWLLGQLWLLVFAITPVVNYLNVDDIKYIFLSTTNLTAELFFIDLKQKRQVSGSLRIKDARLILKKITSHLANTQPNRREWFLKSDHEIFCLMF